MWILVERTGRGWQLVSEVEGRRLAGSADVVPCSPERARLLLGRLGSDPAASPALRRLLARSGATAVAGVPSLRDGEVRAELGRLVARSQVHVLERRRERAPTLGAPGEPELRPDELSPTTASIVYEVLDDASDEPVAGVELLVTLPDGSEVRRKTDGEGRVQIDGLRQGRCGVRAELSGQDLLHVLSFVGFGQHPIGTHAHGRRGRLWERPTVDTLEPVGLRKPKQKPLAVAELVRHRVRTGETLATIAELHDLGVDALLAFNFGTTAHDEVQRLLGFELGCVHRDLGTGDYVLSSEDDPGILFIPKAWQRFGQATDREWVIRVHRITPPAPPYVFSM